MQRPRGRYGRLVSTYLLPEWRTVFVLGVLLAVAIALQLANPLILRSFIDHARSGSSLHTLAFIGVLFLAVAIATQIVAVAETYVAENLGWVATNRLRADLALHCLRLDPSFHNTHTPGELIERIDGDVTALSNFFSRFILYVLSNGILLVGVLVMLWRIDIRVGAALTLFALVSFVAMHRLRDFAAPQWNAARQASAELFGFLEERLSATEDIRSSGAVAYTMRRLYAHARSLLHTQNRAMVMGTATMWTTNTLFTLGTVAALGLGAYLFNAGTVTIGTVYLIYAYTQMMDRPIEEITRQLQDLQQASAGVMRVEALLAERSWINDGPGRSVPEGALSIEFDHVGFAYGDGPAVLHDVTFAVCPGAVLGVVGRTGSGKTTLSRLLFRLYDVDAGAVRVGGVDVRDWTLSGLRERIGIVTQDIQLFHASVRDNLTLFDNTIPEHAIWTVLEDLGLHAWVRGLPAGLETKLEGGAAGLSAGEGQLLAFARVFLRDPDVVVLDEASSRLDPATEARIEHAVDRLLEGRTGIVIAHRLGTVRRADDILVLDGGRVLEHGPRDVLAGEESSHFSRLLRSGLEIAV